MRNALGQFMVGHFEHAIIFTPQVREKMSLAKLGKPRIWSEEAKRSFSEKISDEKHPNWKGDKAGYRALHYWVQSKLGKAQVCEFCGKIKDKPRSVQWANKDHTYKRNLNDWISLCAKCHRKYDARQGRNLIKNFGLANLRLY